MHGRWKGSLASLVLGAGLALTLGACDKAASAGKPGGDKGGPSGGGPPAMPVEVAVARTDTVVDAILATGQVEAMQSIELRPDVEGRIAEILVREGASVARGTPLFKVDDAELKAQVARAEADRDLARQSLARTKDLLAQKASSQSELERADATARVAEAQLALLQVRLDRTVVRAPFTGAVGQRYVSLGDYVTTDTRLASLQTVSPQRASFQVPERYADQLKAGQQVTFRVAALRDKEFLGARLATAVRPSAVVIPEDAIVALQGSTFVWVVTEGKATRRQVDLGVRTPGFVEARTGVEPAEQVVVGGQERLGEGAPVMAKVVDRSRPRVEGDSAPAAKGAAARR